MELGRLRKVEVRTVWESEARDFTPWLLDHHDHLAEALGIDLEIERSEHPVGNFSLDLVGRDLTNDAVLLVAQPNDWQKQVRSATGTRIGSRAALYLGFWTAYLKLLTDKHPDWSGARTPMKVNWMDFQSPIRGTRIVLGFAQDKRLRHEIYIDAGDKTRNEEIFEHLARQRTLFETEYGRPLQWEPLPNARACRIAEYREDADVTFEDRHDEFIDWFLDAGARLRRALSAVGAAVA